MSSTSINLLSGGLLQGTIDGQGGFIANTTRVIMTNRMALPDYLGRIYIITAVTSTGKTINTDFIGYADSTTQTFVYDSDWQSNPKTYDLSSQTSIRYFRIVLKYSDSSTILPEEITALTMSGTTVFHAADGEYPVNDSALPIIQTDFTRPFPLTLWRIDQLNDGYPYHDLQPSIMRYKSPAPPDPSKPESANWLGHWFIRKKDMDLNRESVMGYISQKSNRSFQSVNFKYLPHWNNSIQDLNNKYYEMIGEDENGGPIRLGGEE